MELGYTFAHKHKDVSKRSVNDHLCAMQKTKCQLLSLRYVSSVPSSVVMIN